MTGPQTLRRMGWGVPGGPYSAYWGGLVPGALPGAR